MEPPSHLRLNTNENGSFDLVPKTIKTLSNEGYRISSIAYSAIVEPYIFSDAGMKNGSFARSRTIAETVIFQGDPFTGQDLAGCKKKFRYFSYPFLQKLSEKLSTDQYAEIRFELTVNGEKQSGDHSFDTIEKTIKANVKGPTQPLLRQIEEIRRSLQSRNGLPLG